MNYQIRMDGKRDLSVSLFQTLNTFLEFPGKLPINNNAMYISTRFEIRMWHQQFGKKSAYQQLFIQCDGDRCNDNEHPDPCQKDALSSIFVDWGYLEAENIFFFT